MKIRKSAAMDLPKVRDLDAVAWAGLFPPFEKHTKSYRSLANLHSNWSDDPSGCLIAEDNGEYLGYIFSHLCGTLGYIGTFGVHPKHRGKGIGKKLLQTSIEHLVSSKCTTIGLETRPDNSYNIGMYLAHGFRPTCLTMVTEHKPRKSSASVEAVEWRELDDSTQEVMGEKFLAICNQVQPGLDYLKMAESRIRNSEGEICVFRIKKKKPLGFAFVRTSPKFVGDIFTDAFVEAMVVAPGSEHNFDEMIHALEELARDWGKRSLVVPVKSSDWKVLQGLTRKGFRVRRTMLRMMYTEKKENRGRINLNYWAM
jgi:GNAT superfamily N-acetyltransferase